MFGVSRAVAGLGLVFLSIYYLISVVHSGWGQPAPEMAILAAPLILLGCIGMMLTGGRK